MFFSCLELVVTAPQGELSYWQANSSPRGAISAPFFLSVLSGNLLLFILPYLYRTHCGLAVIAKKVRGLGSNGLRWNVPYDMSLQERSSTGRPRQKCYNPRGLHSQKVYAPARTAPQSPYPHYTTNPTERSTSKIFRSTSEIVLECVLQYWRFTCIL